MQCMCEYPGKNFNTLPYNRQLTCDECTGNAFLVTADIPKVEQKLNVSDKSALIF